MSVQVAEAGRVDPRIINFGFTFLKRWAFPPRESHRRPLATSIRLEMFWSTEVSEG